MCAQNMTEQVLILLQNLQWIYLNARYICMETNAKLDAVSPFKVQLIPQRVVNTQVFNLRFSGFVRLPIGNSPKTQAKPRQKKTRFPRSFNYLSNKLNAYVPPPA